MTVLLNIQINFIRQVDSVFMPTYTMYQFLAYPADPTLQLAQNNVNAFYAVGTPADPSMMIYATLAGAQADFIANQAPALIAVVNSNYPSGPVYTGIGTTSFFTLGSKVSTPVTRTIGGTATQCANPNNDNLVILSLTEAQTISLTTGQTGSLSFQISPTLGGTYTEYSRIGNGNSGALTLGLGLTNTGTVPLIGYVPATYYYKIVPAGTGTNTFVTAQELSF